MDVRNQLASTPLGDTVYDANGNLLMVPKSTGEADFSYDDENRLAQYYNSDDQPDGGPTQYTEFIYDGLGRLRERLYYVWDPDSAQWVKDANETRYIYDGMRVIQERDQGGTPIVSYTRGNDLSGSLEGAGGIGGLLARSSGYSSGNWTGHAYYFSEGNGNVTYMTDGSQAMVASYTYDPFGNTIIRAAVWQAPMSIDSPAKKVTDRGGRTANCTITAIDFMILTCRGG